MCPRRKTKSVCVLARFCKVIFQPNYRVYHVKCERRRNVSGVLCTERGGLSEAPKLREAGSSGTLKKNSYTKFWGMGVLKAEEGRARPTPPPFSPSPRTKVPHGPPNRGQPEGGRTGANRNGGAQRGQPGGPHSRRRRASRSSTLAGAAGALRAVMPQARPRPSGPSRPGAGPKL